MTATTVRERGIIFTEENIRAIIEGRKTQTRRVIKPQPSFGGYPEAVRIVAERNGVIGWWKAGGITAKQLLQHSRYRVGDLLWVKESFIVGYDSGLDDGKFSILKPSSGRDQGTVFYRASFKPDNPDEPRMLWKSARFMPKKYARLWLEITDVRVERVQEISDEAAIAEGLSRLSKDDGRTWKYGVPDSDGLPGNDDTGWHWRDWDVVPRNAFSRLWDRINRKTFPWKSNPWVWCVTFKRIERGPACPA